MLQRSGMRVRALTVGGAAVHRTGLRMVAEDAAFVRRWWLLVLVLTQVEEMPYF